MIVLLTDFGTRDPYVGQVHLKLARLAPQVPVIDLFHDLPHFSVEAAAYLVNAYCADLPAGAIVMAIVDPGVGGSRDAIVLRSGGCYYVGPNNGIFELLARRETIEGCERLFIPPGAAATFHGRDVFAPAAAFLAQGIAPMGETVELARFPLWPDDNQTILYIDHYGNAVTGVRARAQHQTLRVRGHILSRARTFSDRPIGEPFFYENSSGLLEIAAYCASAAAVLGLHLSDPFVLDIDGSVA